MSRPDLLALDDDDLAVLANRGLVKRAVRELESGEPTWQLDEDDRGNVRVRWSDGIECLLAAGRTLEQGRCSCQAAPICRHLIRSVLAYRQVAQSRKPADPLDSGVPLDSGAPVDIDCEGAAGWDPGGMSDEVLGRFFKKPVLTTARRRFEEGLVVELLRGRRPVARFHDLGCSLRLLVPGDLRYTHCDCRETAPCAHIPLAIWAFRLLATELEGGLVQTGRRDWPVPHDLLGEVEDAAVELVELGVAGTGEALVGRLRRSADACSKAGLVWPAQVIEELAEQCGFYAAQDGRFYQGRVVELLGELFVRLGAIRSGSGAVPQLLIRGSSTDRQQEAGNARLVGIGSWVRVRRGGARIDAFLQDADSGSVVAVRRDFVDGAAATDPARPYWRLAQSPAIGGASLAAIAAGQVLTQGGKRTAAGEYLPGRSRSTVTPQTFAWESLRSPLLVEDFSELRLRLAAQPPASLRPRRLGEDLFVCRVVGAEQASFSSIHQSVVALVLDSQGEAARLVHPYSDRGREGAEALIAHLGAARPLRFVSGRARLTADGLVLHPSAAIFEGEDGRTMVQPWIDRHSDIAAVAPEVGTRRAVADPVAAYPERLAEELAELCLVGLGRADGQTTLRWRELERLGLALGFVRLVEPVAVVAAHLEHRSRTLDWDARPCARVVLKLVLLVRMQREVG